jgi:hypothetical protein
MGLIVDVVLCMACDNVIYNDRPCQVRCKLGKEVSSKADRAFPPVWHIDDASGELRIKNKGTSCADFFDSKGMRLSYGEYVQSMSDYQLPIQGIVVGTIPEDYGDIPYPYDYQDIES